MRTCYYLTLAAACLLSVSDVGAAVLRQTSTPVDKLGVLIESNDYDDANNNLRASKSDESINPKQTQSISKHYAVQNKDSDEERFFFDTINRPRYAIWFNNEMTPEDVRREQRRPGFLRLPRNARRRYWGYSEYYYNHCQRFVNRSKAFCRAQKY
ncbi:hypothetical protein CCR75_002497 [Bremia lactucae]|uniref:RxLR effector protein n=1 Tax=Bremia lactucae TaxID=4779 RepID=A0A976IGY8_BRELC|nr:hypothetical protein CCR75_002497 [Bremia lactucae]